jgi:hypothetical protein
MSMLALASYKKGAAKWFDNRGIAVFLLKYPLRRRLEGPSCRYRHYPIPWWHATRLPNQRQLKQVIGLAIADAQYAAGMTRKTQPAGA